MAWELNRCLGINLIKSEDYEVVHKNNLMSSYLQLLSKLAIRFGQVAQEQTLIEGKRKERNMAVAPNIPGFDFILLIRGEAYTDNNRFAGTSCEKIPSVEWVAFIPLEAIKSKRASYFLNPNSQNSNGTHLLQQDKNCSYNRSCFKFKKECFQALIKEGVDVFSSEFLSWHTRRPFEGNQHCKGN